MELWTAFAMGLAGSLHCIGMCGPIALVIPFKGHSAWSSLGNSSIYNVGRISAYGMIGIFAGLLGQGIWMAGFQKGISLALGILLLISVLWSFNIGNQIWSVPFLQKINQFIKTQLGQLLGRRTFSSFLGIGFLNGFLPCGMVYVALAGALMQGDIYSSVLYMLLFGLGTLPMMTFIALAGNLFTIKRRLQLQGLIPVFMLIFAFLFIARGLNVQLPGDLQFWIEAGALPPMCH